MSQPKAEKGNVSPTNMATNLYADISTNHIIEEFAWLHPHSDPEVIIMPHLPGHTYTRIDYLPKSGTYGCFFEIDLSKLPLDKFDQFELTTTWKKINE